ncbi:MAG: thiamine phosphate synthase [Gemmatimonadetes bacterium]|nr:thiamine phosphate synthase [Gemmatimonadota bacterium]MXX13213.1 thiamine phosphate synthase [Gemmatimonadota bacterium]MYB57284.1 thiamine phosphate synthase [Gemmatimonadota bacterium]MYC15189.1 thiamine phosphate synthase [Gemmatimonadota bacterium]MYD59433.1 thiamine phosphate synthase [Gemmatimonadota bacterium]
MNSLPPLYLIADRATCGDRPMLDVLARALDAGVRLVQLREKNLDRDVLEALAEQVLSLTARYDAMLLINSAADIAVQIGAQGVHLPGGALPRAVRDRIGPSFLIGYSTHTCAELDCADGADFVTYSPIFTPGSKPGYDGVEAGLAGLANAVAHSRLPVYALGGITPSRAAKCRTTGCAGVAVMSGILAARDPARAVCEFLKGWE